MAHQASPMDLKERLAAERRGLTFLVLRDGDGRQRLVTLPDDGAVVIGRGSESDLQLEWDVRVSRTHAELQRVGDDWAVVDDGLSRNGSYVNGERVAGRRRLGDGDVLGFGDTLVTFRCSAGGEWVETRTAGDALPQPADLSDAQRRVLVALCRPYKDPGGYATPATNREIADELCLSLDAVKTHMRSLFGRLRIDDLPQNRKRTALVERALQTGLVTARDL